MKVIARHVTAAAVVFCVSSSIGAFDTTFTRADSFLKRYVCNGGVDYVSAVKDTTLDPILTEFAVLPAATFSTYSRNLRLATLINLYNLATIKLIIAHFPVTTIKDIDSAWSRKWISFGGKTISLDQLEHSMIRKQFDEPLIHFALVCAAKSCPELREGAYTSRDLDRQLSNSATVFLGDTSKNRIREQKMKLSKLFSWYGGDFSSRYGGVTAFVKKSLAIEGSFTIDYLSYDWSLNTMDCTE